MYVHKSLRSNWQCVPDKPKSDSRVAPAPPAPVSDTSTPKIRNTKRTENQQSASQPGSNSRNHTICGTECHNLLRGVTHKLNTSTFMICGNGHSTMAQVEHFSPTCRQLSGTQPRCIKTAKPVEYKPLPLSMMSVATGRKATRIDLRIRVYPIT